MGVLRFGRWNVVLGLILYLSITEMLGIDVEQCSCQAWQGGLKVGDGGIVGSLVLGFRGKKGFV